MNADEARISYLIQWRQGLWAQIRQKEDAIWRFVAFYAGAVVLLAALATGYGLPQGASITTVGAVLILLILFVVTLWGVLIALDANFWLQRNLIFIANIEQELLFDSDFDVLLPKKYAKRSTFDHADSYTIHIHFLFFLIFILLLMFARLILAKGGVTNPVDIIATALFVVVFCLGIGYTVYRDHRWLQKWIEVRSQAPGKKLPDKEYPKSFELVRVAWSSRVSIWGWALMLTGCGIFLFLAVLSQPWVAGQAWIGKPLIITFTVLVLGGGLGYLLTTNFWLPSCSKKMAALGEVGQKEKDNCIRRPKSALNVAIGVGVFALLVTVVVWCWMLFQAVELYIQNL